MNVSVLDETITAENPISVLARAFEDKQPAVLVTVIEVNGASPAKVGAQMVICADRTTAGTVGGGKLEAAILADARAALAERQPRLTHYVLAEEGKDAVGTLCGGDVQVFIQPYHPPPKLVIVGGGHIGQPLKIMATATGFEAITVDVEAGRATAPELNGVVLSEDTFVDLMTTDHVSDEAALRQVIDSPVRYIGMIGSRAKGQTILKHLRTDGYSDERLKRVYAPIGLDLGGTTPGEIAVAILAEVIAVRRGGCAEMRSHVKLLQGSASAGS